MFINVLLFMLAGQIRDFYDTDNFYSIQKEIREKHFSDFFNLLQKKDDIKKTIDMTGEFKFFNFFLKKTLNDLDTFERLNDHEKINIISMLNKMEQSDIDLLSKTRKERLGIYKNSEETCIFIREKFGEGSYLDLYTSQQKFAPLTSLKNIDVGNKITGEIKRLEKLGWKDSPYNDIFLYH